MTSTDPAAEFGVYADPDTLAEAVAVRLTRRLAELQQQDRERLPRVALTGGRIATKAYQQLAALHQIPDAPVDWSRVELWWGDERFVAADSADRNDRAALDALLPALPLVEANLHRMPADDGVIDVDNAAELYAVELGEARFDICLLGVGPDGHVASLFPDHPSSTADGTVIAVRDSPKPPPLRTSLTRAVINGSAEVWFIAAGPDKAEAVGWSVTGDVPVPAAAARGSRRTVWMLDDAAAAALPEDVRTDP